MDLSKVPLALRLVLAMLVVGMIVPLFGGDYLLPIATLAAVCCVLLQPLFRPSRWRNAPPARDAQGRLRRVGTR